MPDPLSPLARWSAAAAIAIAFMGAALASALAGGHGVRPATVPVPSVRSAVDARDGVAAGRVRLASVRLPALRVPPAPRHRGGVRRAVATPAATPADPAPTLAATPAATPEPEAVPASVPVAASVPTPPPPAPVVRPAPATPPPVAVRKTTTPAHGPGFDSSG
jgi:hypothetical protein